MNKMRHLTPALSVMNGSAREFDGIVACFGMTRMSDERLPLAGRRQRRQARRRRLM